MEENYVEESEGIGFSISGENSRIQEKIQVVRQVLTLLEDTISSAKTSHQTNQTTYQSKIAALEDQIRILRHEMQNDDDDFENVTGSFEDGIQKYYNLENKLLTIEERSIDDNEIIPKLSESTDIYVAQYLPSQYSEWQRLKLLCQGLNYSTENYQNNVSFKRFKVTVSSVGENFQRYIQAMEKANALNIFRGKKEVPGSPAPQTCCICLTWYKNEIAAKIYTQNNYRKIIEQVLKERYAEYKERRLDIVEVHNTNELDLSFLAQELTIHVQPKTSAGLTKHRPRKITLYQFDETVTHCPPNVTTFNVDAAPPVVSDEVYNNIAASSSEAVPILSDIQRVDEHNRRILNTPMPRRFKVAKLKSRKGRSSKQFEQTIDILSMIGFNETRSNIDTGPTAACVPLSNDITNTERALVTSRGKGGRNSETSSVAEPFVSNESQQELNPNTFTMAIDGVRVNQWTSDYAQQKGIIKLTDIQKQAIQAFKSKGDVIYEGVINGGKTIGMIIGLLDCINIAKDCVQGLVITASSRSSKLVQKAANANIVVCQRLDQLIDTKSKTFEKPDCLILVGTLAETNIFLKKLIYKDGIRFLVLHKADEIFGVNRDKESEQTLAVNKILYALDATTKVIVVRRSMAKCEELDAFCERKLRQKQVITEPMDMHEFLTGRQRNLSGGSKSSHTKSNRRSSTQNEDVNMDEFLTGRQRNLSGGSKSSHTKSSRRSSTQNEDDGKKLSIPGDSDHSISAITSRRESVYEDNNQNLDETEELGCRTFITKEGLQLLGISRNVGIKNDEKVSEDVGDDITHLYANIENGDDSSKIDMISMLNLEEDKAIIFCDDVEKAEWISTRLRQNKLWPQVLHENISAKDQKVILHSYKRGSFCRVLVCTDFLMSISLDSADVVVNFDLPKSIAGYIGRSAYAVRHIRNSNSPDRKGVVVNLILNQFESLKEFETAMGIRIYNCED